MADYIPSRDNDLLPWQKTLSETLPTYAPTLGVSAADVALVQGYCTAINNAINANNAAQAAARQAKKDKDSTVADSITGLRSFAQTAKTNKNYTAAIGTALGIEATAAGFDATAYKPGITAETFPGHVTIGFTKKGVEGVNVYCRLKGQTTWAKLAFDGHSPYVDNRPLASATVPETREYMVIGVLNDEETGQMSDIVQVVFGG